MGHFFEYIGLRSAAAPAQAPLLGRTGVTQARASRCCCRSCWRPAADFLLAGGGLRRPWVSPCLGRGRLAVVLPAEARGVAVAPRQGAREVGSSKGESSCCELGEVGKCAKWRFTEHFSRDPHPCGRSLTGAHPVCCARRRRRPQLLPGSVPPLAHCLAPACG